MKKAIITSASVIVIAAIAGGIILHSRTNADTVPVISDSVDVAQDSVVEESEQETEQAPPVTEEEPEQTEEATSVEPEQDDSEQEEADIVQEEPEAEPIDEALTDITALDKTMYAQSAVNTRSGPSTEYERVGGLTTNEEVHVTGQSNLTAWYRIDVDGAVQFVSNKYLADEKAEVTQPAQTATASNSNQTATAGYTPEALAVLEKNGVSPELATTVGLTSESILFWDSIGQPISITDNSTARVIPEGYTADGIPISEMDLSGLDGIEAY